MCKVHLFQPISVEFRIGNALVLGPVSGVMIGGPTGRSPRAALVKGRHIESCQKLCCNRNKINSVLATIHFISATDVRRCGATSLLKCLETF